MADVVEAMIGAHFLSNDNLQKTLQWISDIKLVPLEQLCQISQFDDLKESSYSHLKEIKLHELTFTKDDNLRTLFEKYFEIPQVSSINKDEF